MLFSSPMARFKDRPQWTVRGIALVLTILVHLLVFLLFLLSHSPVVMKAVDSMPTTFTMIPAEKDKEAGDKDKAKVRQTEKKTKAESASAQRPTPVPVAEKTPPPPAETPQPAFITVPRSAFAAGDISKLPGKGAASGAMGPGVSGPSAAGPGQGPGGVQLYQAEWYRRPTDAELAGFMPPNPPPNGWGLVACRTVEEYHVENCQTLGESPLGSGFAKAVRQAAWQFLVRPPRIDGKPQVGAWVRIRIDYTQSGASVD